VQCCGVIVASRIASPSVEKARTPKRCAIHIHENLAQGVSGVGGRDVPSLSKRSSTILVAPSRRAAVNSSSARRDGRVAVGVHRVDRGVGRGVVGREGGAHPSVGGKRDDAKLGVVLAEVERMDDVLAGFGRGRRSVVVRRCPRTSKAARKPKPMKHCMVVTSPQSSRSAQLHRPCHRPLTLLPRNRGARALGSCG